MGASYEVKDTNNVEKLLNIIDDLASHEIHVGIFGQDDSKILMIATVNEFGWNIDVTDKMRGYLAATGLHLKADTKQIHIPERSFIRGGYDKNKANIEKQISNKIEKVITFELTVDQFYNQMGQACVGMIQEYLTNLSDPANHPYTIDNKNGKTNPLINTGELRQKITYKVVKK